MHVLLTINASWNALNFRLPIIRALLARGDRVTLLAPMDASVPALQELGVDHVHLQMDTSGLNPIEGIALSRMLYHHFKEINPDTILSYTIKNNIFGAIAAKRLGIPFLPNVSGLGTAFLSGKVLQFVAEQLYRNAFRNLRTVFFQNEEDRDLFLQRRLIHPGQAWVLPGSKIDLAYFQPSPQPEGPPVFLMIGRLLRDKGVFEYVGAAGMVKSVHPDATFQLLGATDANNRSAVTADIVQGWQDMGVIDYLGTTDDVRPHIAAASAIVLPSYREGAPRTLIEAAAMARPAIATDVPGCRSVVAHEVTGFLCKSKSAQSLAEAFGRFIALSLDDKDRLGRAARARMEQTFEQKVIVNAYLDAIDK